MKEEKEKKLLTEAKPLKVSSKVIEQIRKKYPKTPIYVFDLWLIETTIQETAKAIFDDIAENDEKLQMTYCDEEWKKLKKKWCKE
jgi:diketogulonate reductase-like aldo/keto reductase